MDWTKYAKITKETYDRKYNIKDKMNKNKNKFKVGQYVLYFCGDRQVTLRKWRQRWSGPWRITTSLNDRSRIIEDEDSGEQKCVTIDRLKMYNKDKYYTIDEYNKLILNGIEKKNEIDNVDLEI